MNAYRMMTDPNERKNVCFPVTQLELYPLSSQGKIDDTEERPQNQPFTHRFLTQQDEHQSGEDSDHHRLGTVFFLSLPNRVHGLIIGSV